MVWETRIWGGVGAPDFGENRRQGRFACEIRRVIVVTRPRYIPERVRLTNGGCCFFT